MHMHFTLVLNLFYLILILFFYHSFLIFYVRYFYIYMIMDLLHLILIILYHMLRLIFSSLYGIYLNHYVMLLARIDIRFSFHFILAFHIIFIIKNDVNVIYVLIKDSLLFMFFILIYFLNFVLLYFWILRDLEVLMIYQLSLIYGLRFLNVPWAFCIFCYFLCFILSLFSLWFICLRPIFV